LLAKIINLLNYAMHDAMKRFYVYLYEKANSIFANEIILLFINDKNAHTY